MSERYSGCVPCGEQPPHQKFTKVDWPASWAADPGDERGRGAPAHRRSADDPFGADDGARGCAG